MTQELYTDIVNYLKNCIINTEFENKVYTVGGCCRDIILGNDIKDIDLVIELPNGGIKLAEWLYEHNYLISMPVIYTSYGTAMFHLNKYPNIELEAVQTRSEEYINRNSRNPATSYGSIKDDCFRRDLTINAIYYNISTNEYLDICGHSFDDIKNHIIKTPCDPNITYIDDPLRILRCVRFATRYGWKIDPLVLNAMKTNIDRLNIISAERITEEFNKILLTPNNKNLCFGINLLWGINGFKYIFPSITENPAKFLNNNTITTYVARLTIILLLSSNQREELLNRKFPTTLINRVLKNIELINEWEIRWINAGQYADKNKQKKLSSAFLYEYEYACGSERVLQDISNIINIICPDIRDILNIKRISSNKYIHFYDYKLPINGDDIIMLGIKPGPIIKKILNTLLIYAYKNPKLNKIDCMNIIKNKFLS